MVDHFQWLIRPITVIVPYTNEQGYQEIYFAGFLTSERHAMYIEEPNRDIVFVEVLPSRDPGAYIDVTGYVSLGKISEYYDPMQVVSELTNRLKQMTAYEFLATVIIKLRDEVDFDDLITLG